MGSPNFTPYFFLRHFSSSSWSSILGDVFYIMHKYQFTLYQLCPSFWICSIWSCVSKTTCTQRVQENKLVLHIISEYETIQVVRRVFVLRYFLLHANYIHFALIVFVEKLWRLVIKCNDDDDDNIVKMPAYILPYQAYLIMDLNNAMWSCSHFDF